jgi:hypothetical protein
MVAKAFDCGGRKTADPSAAGCINGRKKRRFAMIAHERAIIWPWAHGMDL